MFWYVVAACAFFLLGVIQEWASSVRGPWTNLGLAILALGLLVTRIVKP